MTWSLHCSVCSYTQPDGSKLASLCPDCGQPLLVRYAAAVPRTAVTGEASLWRYGAALPLARGETAVTLGEGMTPMIELPHLARDVGVRRLWVKDEGINPTASFKARGLMMAVTRARALGLPGVCVPTAGNAGIALAAYAAAAQMPCRIFAPETTPPPILGSIRALGAHLATDLTVYLNTCVSLLQREGRQWRLVADSGAGTGYLTRRIAPKVLPRGKVYAVEIQQEMLDLLTNKLAGIGITNVVPALGTIVDPKLPANSVDTIIMVDVYHEFDHPYEMTASMCRALKPGGRIVFVEFRGEDEKVPIKRVHKMTEAQVKKEMAPHPLAWKETISVLPWQHIIVFTRQ